MLENKTIELNDEELKKAAGGNFEEDRGIMFSDDCHFKPSRFVDACDPNYWSFSECARCVYNSNRHWEWSKCLYDEQNQNQK